MTADTQNEKRGKAIINVSIKISKGDKAFHHLFFYGHLKSWCSVMARYLKADNCDLTVHLKGKHLRSPADTNLIKSVQGLIATIRLLIIYLFTIWASSVVQSLPANSELQQQAPHSSRWSSRGQVEWMKIFWTLPESPDEFQLVPRLAEDW